MSFLNKSVSIFPSLIKRSVSRNGIAQKEESHLTSGKCKVFGDLKEMFGDLHDYENHIQFFQEVLPKKDEIDNPFDGWANTIVGANPAS